MIPGSYDVETPWARQPCDTNESWRAFSVWLGLGPSRLSVDGYAVCYGLRVEQVRGWAASDHWEPRAELYDRHCREVGRAAIKLAAREETAADVDERHMRPLRAMLEICYLECLKYLEAAKAGKMHGLLSPREIARMVEVGIKYERLIRGATTERIGGNFDLGALATEELRQLKALQAKAGMDP